MKTFVIFMPDDNSVVPPVEYGYLAVPPNDNGTHRWVRDVKDAFHYPDMFHANNALAGDARFKTNDKAAGARVIEIDA
jgi:fructose-specific component phosphotransferase system IIB-like protein